MDLDPGNSIKSVAFAFSIQWFYAARLTETYAPLRGFLFEQIRICTFFRQGMTQMIDQVYYTHILPVYSGVCEIALDSSNLLLFAEP